MNLGNGEGNFERFLCLIVKLMERCKYGVFDELEYASINFLRVWRCIKLFLYEFNSLAEVGENS